MSVYYSKQFWVHRQKEVLFYGKPVTDKGLSSVIKLCLLSFFRHKMESRWATHRLSVAHGPGLCDRASCAVLPDGLGGVAVTRRGIRRI